MRRPDDALLARATAGLSSLALAASAVLASQLGQDHMTRCGAGIEVHCGWCVVAAGLALAALAMLAESAPRPCSSTCSPGQGLTSVAASGSPRDRG